MNTIADKFSAIDAEIAENIRQHSLNIASDVKALVSGEYTQDQYDQLVAEDNKILFDKILELIA